MSGHDDQIGQEWTGERLAGQPIDEYVEAMGNIDVPSLRRVLAYLSGRVPEKVREAVLHVEHSQGRHADGKCPELCPRF